MIRIKKNNPVLIFIVVFGLLIFLHGVGILRPLENFFLNLIKPTSSRFYNWGTNFSNRYDERKNREDLILQLEESTKEVARLTVDNSRFQEIEAENKKLRNQLNFLSVNSFQAVMATIIAREAAPQAGEEGRDVIIDKGEKDGLRVGLGVVSGEGVIVGKVVEVKSNTAKVCLTTRPDCKLAAALQNESKTQGITDGDLGLTIKMEYIPQLEKISSGNIVITSGLGGNIPRGLVIGRVSAVHGESNEVWQEATIEPLINFNNLTVVSVIIP